MSQTQRGYFLVLFAVLSMGVAAFFAVAESRQSQLIIGFLTALSYAVWGVSYHQSQKDLHLKVVVEYLLIASVAFWLLWIATGN